jgi:hypothetical protein
MSKTFCELVNCPDSMKTDFWNNANVVWTLKDNMCMISSHLSKSDEKFPCYYLTKKGTLRKRIPREYQKMGDRDKYKRDGIVLISAYLKWKNEQESEKERKAED